MWGSNRADSLLSLATAASDEANRLAPDLAAAHVARGTVRYWGHFDYPSGAPRVRASTATRPNDPLAQFLLVSGCCVARDIGGRRLSRGSVTWPSWTRGMGGCSADAAWTTDRHPFRGLRLAAPLFGASAQCCAGRRGELVELPPVADSDGRPGGGAGGVDARRVRAGLHVGQRCAGRHDSLTRSPRAAGHARRRHAEPTPCRDGRCCGRCWIRPPCGMRRARWPRPRVTP